MVTGLVFVLLGIAVLFYPQILVAIASTILVLFGLGLMATSWQFRRLQKQSGSKFIPPPAAQPAGLIFGSAEYFAFGEAAGGIIIDVLVKNGHP